MKFIVVGFLLFGASVFANEGRFKAVEDVVLAVGRETGLIRGSAELSQVARASTLRALGKALTLAELDLLAARVRAQTGDLRVTPVLLRRILLSSEEATTSVETSVRLRHLLSNGYSIEESEAFTELFPQIYALETVESVSYWTWKGSGLGIRIVVLNRSDLDRIRELLEDAPLAYEVILSGEVIASTAPAREFITISFAPEDGHELETFAHELEAAGFELTDWDHDRNVIRGLATESALKRIARVRGIQSMSYGVGAERVDLLHVCLIVKDVLRLSQTVRELEKLGFLPSRVFGGVGLVYGFMESERVRELEEYRGIVISAPGR